MGILEIEDAEVDASARRYRLPDGHDEVLVDSDSLNYLAPLTQLVAGAVHPIQSLWNG